MKKDKILKFIALFLFIVLIALSFYRIYEYVVLKDDNVEENDNNGQENIKYDI